METNLLDILVCPLCKGKLEYDRVEQEFICRFDRLAYPICDGIPVMLVSEARTVSLTEDKNYKEDNHDD